MQKYGKQQGEKEVFLFYFIFGEVFFEEGGGGILFEEGVFFLRGCGFGGCFFFCIKKI